MLHVKTKIGNSNIHGLGCFANENIKKGEIVWTFDNRVDIKISESEMRQLPKVAQELFEKYGYTNIVDNERLVILCGDNARFMNHSDHPNTSHKQGSQFDTDIAVRDIFAGEELTCNYYSFDLDAENKLAIIILL
jgi:uncharacterized protein